MSLALKGKANQIRSKDPKLGDVVAAAFVQASDDIDAISNLLSVVSLFKVDQLGGVSINALAIREATTRYVFEDLPDIQYVTAATQQLIVHGHDNRLKNTSGGNLTLTGTPTIASAKNGQETIWFNPFPDSIVLQDRLTLAGSGLFLAAATRSLGPRSNITFRFSTELNGHVEHAFSAIL